eukprot:g16424.t1
MQNLEKLSATIGACERLVQTPVPLSYVRHTSRFLSLPFALVDVLGPYTIPVTCFASWALFGIFEIGLVIEDPFQGVLKVEVIAETLQADIEECIRSLGALDLLDAGALGKEVKRSDASSSSYAPSPSFIAQDGSVDTFKPPELTNGRGRLRDVKEMNEEKRKPQVLLEIFQSYDVNGDQAIDKKEMQKVLQDSAADMDVPSDCIDVIFDEADSDGDGLLTQAEWCAWAEACLDRAEIADLVLRMPSSPLLPADSHDDTWEAWLNLGKGVVTLASQHPLEDAEEKDEEPQEQEELPPLPEEKPQKSEAPSEQAEPQSTVEAKS